MEDPWANAWGDTPKPVLPEPTPLWAAPSVSVLNADNEDDLSAPSWASDWSAEDLSGDHIWSTAEISSTWNSTSTSDGISVDTQQQNPRTETSEAGAHSSSLPLHEETWALQNVPIPQSIPSEPLETTSISNVGPGCEDEEDDKTPKSSPRSISLPKPTPASLSDDSDGFGSFETGEDNLDKGSWTPTNSVLPPTPSTDSANWDTAWQAESEYESHEQGDAWETAKRQKEKRDRHPPVLLSSILRQFEEFSKELWEDLGPSSAGVNDNLDFEMLGLEPVLTRISPDDMTLTPSVPFAKTFTMKHMSESLKLTRHYPSTCLSPMAMYLASKGSNSWEAAIKARPIVTSDDVTPVGWKIVDPSAQGESPLDDGKKKAGGIFSFFGRKTHNLSIDGSSKQPSSPLASSGVSSPKTSTSRAESPAALEPSSTSDRPKPVVPDPLNVVSEVDTKSPSTIPTIDAAKDEIQLETTQPSAVSRFLGRIVGRSKTRSIDSLALSADDLKFLSDVPTSSDSNALQNEDIITILDTPPPAPSPRPLATPSHQESPFVKLPPPPSRPSQSIGSDDLLSLFDPSPIPTLHENSRMNVPLPRAMSSGKAATCQSNSPNQMWSTFEEVPIKPTSSRHRIEAVDLLKSSSRQITNGIKSDIHRVGSASIPVLALPIPPSTALPLKSVQVDDDEFSDFLSSPAVGNSQFSSFPLDSLGSSSVSVPSIKMTDTHHDDFGEFGGAVDDFPAPRTPPSVSRSPAIVSIPSTQSETAHTRKKASKKADHSRTLSLLENAAARGRWLAPPSPIPEALSPPPDRSASRSLAAGPDDRKMDMQSQQSLAMAAFSSEKLADAWRLPPPPSGILLTPSAIPSTPVRPRLMPPSRPEFVAQLSRSPSSAQSGGLSAQDLSFFEGL